VSAGPTAGSGGAFSTNTQSELLVDAALPGEVRGALLAGGRVFEYALERRDQPSRLGEVFLGRVGRRAGTMGFFADIGLPRAGVLAPPRKDRPLAEGAAVLVQVTADGYGSKGPKLTTDIALSGPNLVLAAASGECAARKGSVGADPEILAVEEAQLRGLLAAIEAQAKTASAPSRLHGIDDPLARLLAWFAPFKPSRCVIDGAEAFARARGFCREACPELARGLEIHRAVQPLFEAREIESEIEQLAARRIELPAGPAIVIEEMETLTAIDVDTGALMGRAGGEMALRANLAAAAEIARQIRLRNIGGLIVIDALRLRRPDQGKKVLAALRAEAAQDRVPTHVHGFTASGLIEVTRERGRPPLSALLFEDWAEDRPGRRKRPATVAFEVLRAARHEGARGGAVVCRVAPGVGAFLAGEGRADVAALESLLGRTVRIESDAALAADRFRIASASSRRAR
jgi:ribonuclease G